LTGAGGVGRGEGEKRGVICGIGYGQLEAGAPLLMLLTSEKGWRELRKKVL